MYRYELCKYTLPLHLAVFEARAQRLIATGPLPRGLCRCHVDFRRRQDVHGAAEEELGVSVVVVVVVVVVVMGVGGCGDGDCSWRSWWWSLHWR